MSRALCDHGQCAYCDIEADTGIHEPHDCPYTECDVCGDDITGDYFPGVNRCDTCSDRYGLEEPETLAEFRDGPRGDPGDIFEEPESLTDCLQDIARSALLTRGE